jgi:hypothetical protein
MFLIANECLNSRIRSTEPGVLCKLDIENACDHINWDFLLYMLWRCGFGEIWRKWIAYCISSVCSYALVNGTPTGGFSSSPGLRQRDPLSPFLFIIVMEALSKMNSALGNEGLLAGFTVGPRSDGAINISHLLSVDDNLIFSRVNPYHFHNLLCFFLYFEAVSGLRINWLNQSWSRLAMSPTSKV